MEHPLWQRIKAAGTAAREESAPADLSGVVEKQLQFYLNSKAANDSSLYDQIMREVEKPLLQATLNYTRGNQLRAARLLGINRNTLHKKVKELGIKSPKKNNGSHT
jgi:two-component system nitrogen regulation response regulator GlnG